MPIPRPTCRDCFDRLPNGRCQHHDLRRDDDDKPCYDFRYRIKQCQDCKWFKGEGSCSKTDKEPGGVFLACKHFRRKSGDKVMVCWNCDYYQGWLCNRTSLSVSPQQGCSAFVHRLKPRPGTPEFEATLTPADYEPTVRPNRTIVRLK